MPINSSTCLDVCMEMSTPASAITFIALGLTPDGHTPAEYGSMRSAFKYLAQPCAIWLRQELPVQRKRILVFFHVQTSMSIVLQFFIFGQLKQIENSSQLWQLLRPRPVQFSRIPILDNAKSYFTGSAGSISANLSVIFNAEESKIALLS